MDRRIALAVVTLAICGALWAVLSRVGGRPNERVAASTMLLSDLPGHYLATSSSGPCQSNVGSSVPVLLLQVRAEPSGQASIYLNTVNWPMMPDRPPDSTPEQGLASEPVASVALPFNDAETVTRLVRANGGTRLSQRCIVYRADQSLRAGDAYSIGLALQRTQGSQVLIFPELALE